MAENSGVTVLGIFVADTAYLAPRMPEIGETLAGTGFSVGPGGKGSNQAVAAARAGAEVSFISKLGRDTFGDMARKVYQDSGINQCLTIMDDLPTGAAFIFVNQDTAENAIIVYPGAAGTITSQDVLDQREVIEASKVFVTQLEQPAEAALCGLEMAKKAGVTTVFNPAPAGAFPDEIFQQCDYIAPNETEAEALVGFPIVSTDDAKRAGEILLEKGVGTALITLGEKGVYLHSPNESVLIPAMTNAPVLDTSGAGDAFIGGFTAALAGGMSDFKATRFGCATAGISVTRRGTAPAMPMREEVVALLDASEISGA